MTREPVGDRLGVMSNQRHGRSPHLNPLRPNPRPAPTATETARCPDRKGAGLIHRVAAIVLVAVSASLLTGCGSTDAEQSQTPDSVAPSGACPDTEVPLSSSGTCVPFEPDANARSNEAYRQRHDLTAEARELAGGDRAKIADLLRELTESGPIDGPAVEDFLLAHGFPNTVAYGRSDVGGGVAFGTDLQTGCAFGGIKGSDVTIEIGGAIADGGCLPARGH